MVKRQPSEWGKIIANEITDKQSPKYTSSSYSSILEKQTTQSKAGNKAKDISPKKTKRWLINT